jgi:hypothetical protein
LIFPALDRALEDLIGTGPLVLPTGFQTAAAITPAA